MRIVDVQAHYLPRAFIERLEGARGYPRIERQGDRLVLCHGPGLGHPALPAMYDIEQRLKEMDAAGVDVQLLSTTLPGPEMLSDPHEGAELARAANNETASIVRAHAGRFAGMAALPLRDGAAAVRELERAHFELGFPAAGLYSNVAGVPLDEAGLEPLFERAAELGTVLFLHPTYPLLGESCRDHNLIPMLGFMLDTSLAVARLLFSGLLRRLPHLKLVVHHLGGTLPFLLGRMDYESGRIPGGREGVGEPPSRAFARLYLDVASMNPGAIRLARHWVGAKRLLFGSDHPFWDMTDGLRCVKEVGLSAEEEAAVLGANAAQLLHLRP